MNFEVWLHELQHGLRSTLHQNMLLLGAFIVLFGLVSMFVKERLYLTDALVATLVGILCGPYVLGITVPERWFESVDFHFVLREFSRLVIGIQVMAAGVTIPTIFISSNKQSILMLLGPLMVIMWTISALSIRFFLGQSWADSFTIAACVTPTDPVLANSVIKGKFAERHIPTRIRNLLSVESGCNDGLGFPFMMLPLWLIMSKNAASALGSWFLFTWVWEILVSVAVGAALGWIARKLLKLSLKHKLIDKESFLVFTIALTFIVLGVVRLISSDDLFAVFVAGCVFARDDAFVEMSEESHVNEVIDMLFNMAFFIFFGSIIPWEAFATFEIWRLMLCALMILLFRRLPAVMLLKSQIPLLHSRKEAFFAGWFGPMGVGALFFATEAREILKDHKLDIELGRNIYPIVSFIVLSSILIHGITVPLTNSHLKRRMKRKNKKKRKREIIARKSQSPPVSDYDASSDADEEGQGSDYVYITDTEFEDDDEGGDVRSPPYGQSGLSKVVIMNQ